MAIGSAAEARGGFGLLAVTLPDSGLKLWVVPCVALGIAAIEPEGGAIAALGRRSYGRELALGGLGRNDGLGY